MTPTIHQLDLPPVVTPEEPMTYMGDFERTLEQHFCHLFGGFVVDEHNASCVGASLCGHPLPASVPGHPMENYTGAERCACGNAICPECFSVHLENIGPFVPLPEVEA